MSLIVAAIPLAARLVDTIEPVDASSVRGLKTAGADGLILYLGGNLTPEVVKACDAEGMGIVPVNYSRAPGWIPTEELGEEDSELSTRRLDALNVPTEGLHDWCDLEGVGADPTPYLHAWPERVLSAKRRAGMYFGSGGRLTGAQAYALPGFTAYWRGLSADIPEVECGFQMVQLYPSTMLAGLGVDWNVVQRDALGRAPTWLIAA